MVEITAQELKEKIDNDDSFILLDVRDPFEQYQAKIGYEHSVIIPADRLQEQLDEVEAFRDDEIICMCRSGGRSNEAGELLEENGFQHVKLLKGGIHQWAREIDESMPIY